MYNNTSENSSKAIVHKTKEKKLWKLCIKRPKLTWKTCFTGIINHNLLFFKRLYKHSRNLFPPVTNDEHRGVWNMSYS